MRSPGGQLRAAFPGCADYPRLAACTPIVAEGIRDKGGLVPPYVPAANAGTAR